MPGKAALDKLANHLPPRRAAARKASKLAAKQLESSPIPSDAENDGGVSFGEPSTPRGSGVKVKYGGKRKYKQSPTAKPSPAAEAGPSRTRPRPKSLLEESPRKPKSSAGRGRGASRGRGARKTRRTHARSVSSVSSSSGSSSGHSSDLEVLEDPPKVPISRRAAVVISTKPVSKAGPSNGFNAAANGSKKRHLSLSSSDSDGSLLTPLPSPEVQKSPVTRQMPVLAPRLARQFMRSQSHADPILGSSQKNALKQTKSFEHLFVFDSSSDEESLEDNHDIGSLVWVSIDLEGNLLDEDEGDTLWWPAKVYLPRPCMRVALLGEPPGHTDAGPRHSTIPNPSPSNVRSMSQNGRIRFSDVDYRPSRRPSAQSSPRKKRKLDVDAAWREARDLMLREERAQNGGGPSALLPSKAPPSSTGGRRKLNPFPSLDTQASRGKGKGKAKTRRRDSASDVSLSDLDEDDGLAIWKPGNTWRAPSANPLLEIPGELVLAREGRARTQYWPAKLLEYLKPKSHKQRPRYRALFFDGTILQIEPDWFWTTTDEEFGTCKLGESTGNYGLDSDVDADSDGEVPEDFNRPFASADEAELRASSPLPTLPPPAPEVFEYDLPLPEQFDYVKPVLAAVIEGTYGPSQADHEGFMRGAGARQKVLNSVPLRGSLSARDKEEVAYMVRSWARRRERRREMGLSVEYPPEKLYLPASGSAGEAQEPAAGEANGHGDDSSDAESLLTPTSDASGGDTEPLVSEAGPPSSSLAATEVETDDDEQARIAAVDSLACEVAHAVSAETSSANLHSENPTTYAHVSSEDATAAATDTAGAAHETVLPLAPPRTTFHDLDAVEKLTYCNNVLLQEAILQLTLWRTGQRDALGLLSPAEEQRLHDLAMEEGEKTNWVHDIIRLRQAAEQSMLPTGKGKGKEKAAEPAPGARARTRRGV